MFVPGLLIGGYDRNIYSVQVCVWVVILTAQQCIEDVCDLLAGCFSALRLPLTMEVDLNLTPCEEMSEGRLSLLIGQGSRAAEAPSSHHSVLKGHSTLSFSQCGGF